SRRPCPRSARRPRPTDPLAAWRPRPCPRLTSPLSRGLGRGALAGEIGAFSEAPEPKAQPPRKRSGKRTARAHGRWKVALASAPTEQGRRTPGRPESLRLQDSGGARTAELSAA